MTEKTKHLVYRPEKIAWISYIKAFRLSKNWTAQYVAKEMGLDIKTYLQYESGIIKPTDEELEAFAKLYNVSLYDITEHPYRMENVRNLMKSLLELYDSVDNIIKEDVIILMLRHSHADSFQELRKDARLGDVDFESIMVALEERGMNPEEPKEEETSSEVYNNSR